MKTKNFILLPLILAAIISGCVSIERSTPEESDSQFKENEIIYFYYPGCPYCAHAKEFIDVLKTRYGTKISVKEINVQESIENKELYEHYFEKSDESAQGVPFIFINNNYIMGWTNDNEAELESYIIK